MRESIRLVSYGIGAIGRKIALSLTQKKGVEIVGAVDAAKNLLGKDLGEVLGLGATMGVEITDEPERLFSDIEADVVVHATTSHLETVAPQIMGCVAAGLNVVSTCEELSYPYHKHEKLAKRLDSMAKKQGVTVLGTGINPGYLMDTLPIVLTAPCLRVDGIRVVRMMDSSKRRRPFQEKIGTGLSVEEFQRRIDKGEITGHVGLVESISMIVSALGWKLDELRELPPEAVISDKELITPYKTVLKGDVAGLRSVAHGIRGGREAITLEFVAHANVEEEYDSIQIDGEPPIYEIIKGGVHGDTGTVAIVTNSIPKVLKAPPGLVTMKDLPLPSAAA
ncbi:MAG: dihydrodipicolinate reductase [Candidatus Geothermarchaeales archaeon]